MEVKNYFLCGMSGVGKTSVGKILSQKLSLPFVDVDQLLEKDVGKSISEIFAQLGESRFRELETQTLKNICAQSGKVVSLGGGALTREENVDLLQGKGKLIYLKASIEEIASRVFPQKGHRPLFADIKTPEDLKEKLREMLGQREEAYSCAHITILTDGLNPEEISKKILEHQ